MRDMEEKRSFFHQMGEALSKPTFAHGVVNGRRGAGGYFMKLTLLLAGVFLLCLFLAVYPLGGLDAAVELLDDSVGDFSLRDGQLRMSLTEPFVYDGGSTLLILDNDPNALVLNEYRNYWGQVLYFGPDSMIVMSGGQVVPLSYSTLGFAFDKADLLAAVRANAWWVVLLASLFFWIGKLIGGLVYAFCIAILSLILGLILRKALPFGKMLALSLFALTGIFLVETALSCVNLLADTALVLPWYISWVVTLTFMGFYLTAVRRRDDEEGQASQRTLPDDF